MKLSTLNHTAGRPHGPRTQVDKSREQSSRKCQFRLHVSPACQSSGQPLTSVPFLGVLGRPRVNTRTCTGTPRIPYIGACAIPYHELYGGELTLPYVTTSTKLQDVYKRCTDKDLLVHTFSYISVRSLWGSPYQNWCSGYLQAVIRTKTMYQAVLAVVKSVRGKPQY